MSTDSLTAIHTAYCKATGTDPRDLALNIGRQTILAHWLAYGKTSRGEAWGVADLLYVIGHIKKGIGNKSRNHGALRFNNLFGQLDTFEEDLAEVMKRIRIAQREKPRTVPAEQQVGEVRRAVEMPAPETPAAINRKIRDELNELRRKMGKPPK